MYFAKLVMIFIGGSKSAAAGVASDGGGRGGITVLGRFQGRCGVGGRRGRGYLRG